MSVMMFRQLMYKPTLVRPLGSKTEIEFHFPEGHD